MHISMAHTQFGLEGYIICARMSMIASVTIMRSKRLASHKVTSVRSEHDIILKASVDVAFGEIIRARTPNFDSIHLGRTPHRALDFQITDRFGKPIPYLYDPRISFTIVFYG